MEMSNVAHFALHEDIPRRIVAQNTKNKRQKQQRQRSRLRPKSRTQKCFTTPTFSVFKTPEQTSKHNITQKRNCIQRREHDRRNHRVTDSAIFKSASIIACHRSNLIYLFVGTAGKERQHQRHQQREWQQREEKKSCCCANRVIESHNKRVECESVIKSYRTKHEAS